MSETAKGLLVQVLTLNEDERAMVADGIWASLSDDPTLDPDFYTELERRSDEAHDHPERLIDGPTFMAELQARLRAGELP